MAEFLADLYMPKSAVATVEIVEARVLRRRRRDGARRGTPVRYVRSIFVPDDETCFFLFEADTVERFVHDAAVRAGLRFDQCCRPPYVHRGHIERSPGFRRTTRPRTVVDSDRPRRGTDSTSKGRWRMRLRVLLAASVVAVVGVIAPAADAPSAQMSSNDGRSGCGTRTPSRRWAPMASPRTLPCAYGHGAGRRLRRCELDRRRARTLPGIPAASGRPRWTLRSPPRPRVLAVSALIRCRPFPPPTARSS